MDQRAFEIDAGDVETNANRTTGHALEERGMEKEKGGKQRAESGKSGKRAEIGKSEIAKSEERSQAILQEATEITEL